MNDDLWRSLISPLPCLEATTPCIQQLQGLAAANNPLLKELDSKIEQINEKIEEAKSNNKQSIQLSIFEPAVQYFLRQGTASATPGQTTSGSSGGFLNNVLGILTNPVQTFNDLLSAIGLPLFRSFFGGNEQQKAAAIAIGDLQVKVAELERGRAELAQKVKDAVQLSAIDFDVAAREFQIAQAIAIRDRQRFSLFQVNYRFGQSTTEAYLGQQNALDRSRTEVLREWAALRRQLERIKLLCLANNEE